MLIVGDRDLAPELGKTLVWGEGVERLHASSRAAALEIAPVFVPTLVLLDANDVDAARGLVQRLRAGPGTRRSSIVVIARTPELSDDDLLEAGANLVLRPPIDVVACDEAFRDLLAVPRRVRSRFLVRYIPSKRPAGAAPVEAVALDVSVGGMLIETDKAPPQPGETLDLVLSLPGDVEVALSGQVVRLYAVTGSTTVQVGIHFRDLADEARESLDDMVSAMGPELFFGRYEVLGLLGQGAMGRVYRAFDAMARRVVALKAIKPDLLQQAEVEEYLTRFRREAQAAARLVHPNIVTIYDVGHDHFVMELLEGRTLHALMRERGRLSPDEARGILGPVADALDYAHSQGTIHRDIKPANIMVRVDGRPTVMDFGIAHLSSPGITPSGETFGTPAYMAPEQVANKQVVPASDVFSLAAVAYEMLTGRRPFQGESVMSTLYNVVHKDALPPTSLNPALPAIYDEVLGRGLAKDPAERFPCAADLVAALDPVATARLVVTDHAVAPDPPASTDEPFLPPTVALGTRKRRGRAKWGIAVSSIALALAAIAWGPGLFPSKPTAQPPPPGLVISTTPAGATVFVDGAEVGRTPQLVTGLAVGGHSIRVVHPEYAPAELTLETTGEGPPIPLRFTLSPLTATLFIDSVPPASTVEIDGRRHEGPPSAGLPIAAGVHRIVIRRAGFRTWTRAVEAAPGESLRLSARLEPTGGPITTTEALRAKGWVGAGDLVPSGPGVTPPRKITGEPAAYPQSARRMRLAGSVTASFTVTETGAVADPQVIESAGELLDDALIAAIRSWRYEPAEKNGVKVRVRLRERHTFARD
ncbi:MAG TPA: TonB family protein [Vicinamibacteria bacterium]